MQTTPGSHPKKSRKAERGRKPDRLVWVGFFALLIYSVWTITVGSRVKEVSYSDFLKLLGKNEVTKIEVTEDVIRFWDNAKPPKVSFTTPLHLPELEKELKGKPVEYKAIPANRWGSEILMYWVMPVILMIGLWIFFSRRVLGMSDAVMKFSKSRARRMPMDHPVVNFRDVAGVEEAKEELAEIIDFLRDPAKYTRLGGKIPKGLLLVGPPGTGKTLLARAVAGEAGVPFFSMSGSDFVEMFVGVGAARVRDLFEQSKKHAPCIIFIDELDAVGRHRGAGLGGGHDEREQTLNQLLVEMDGFESRKGVIIVAATNRPDVLDPALLRPGRFDRQVVIDAPDLRGRLEILKVHSREVPLSSDVQLEKIAQRTPGFSGADLANVVNEAALLAARRDKQAISHPELYEAVERVIAGPERKSRLINEREKRVVAYHESGHTLVALSLEGTDPVQKVSIIPRGAGALGYTLQMPAEDRYITTQVELVNRITALMGGRAAEQIVFGHLSTGAHNDLEKVSAIARRMVCEFGMSTLLGPVTYGKKEAQVFLGRDIMHEKNYSEKTAQKIDDEVHNVITAAHEVATRVLTERRADLDTLALTLLEREVMDAEEIVMLLRGETLPPRIPKPPPVNVGPDIEADQAAANPVTSASVPPPVS